MNNFIPQTSLFIGIIPALIILYIGLKGYEGHFKDKLIFLTFIVGIIIGFISAVIELFTRDIGLIIYIILFPVLEQLSKTIVLNLGRFQEKQETTIYGLSLGLGFGSVFTPAAIIHGEFSRNKYRIYRGHHRIVWYYPLPCCNRGNHRIRCLFPQTLNLSHLCNTPSDTNYYGHWGNKFIQHKLSPDQPCCVWNHCILVCNKKDHATNTGRKSTTETNTKRNRHKK